MAAKKKTAVPDEHFISGGVEKGRRIFSAIEFRKGMDLSGQDLRCLSFSRCGMPGAKFDGAKLTFASFSKLDLTTVTGLDKAYNLGFAGFNLVRVTTAQSKLIKRAVKRAKGRLSEDALIIMEDMPIEKLVRT
jgi:hypothetical protein